MGHSRTCSAPQPHLHLDCLLMGVRLDCSLAEERLNAALELATSNEDLPEEWLERAARVGLSNSLTFTPMLGTALLAKATDDHVSALALKEGAAHNAYSARGIGHQVLVPFAQRHHVNLRTTGAEPLNNQPFFRYEVVDRDMKVKAGTQQDLYYLVECLERADFLRSENALLALAAFLRVRILDAATELVGLDLPGTLPLHDLFSATQAFVLRDAEEGRRGQAFAAAALDLVYEAVETKRVHDPSRNWPGDVSAYDGRGKLILSVEVRQKRVAGEDVSHFRHRLASAGVRRGAIFALAVSQEMLTPSEDLADCLSLQLEVIVGVERVLRTCVLMSRYPMDEVLEQFPKQMLRRLYELECRPSTIDQWRNVLLGAELGDDPS